MPQARSPSSDTAGGGAPRFGLKFRDHVIPLRGEPLVIGRSPGCDIVLDNALVSRRHARIVPTDSGFALEDLGSVNGVLVNGKRLRAPQTLGPGDRIDVGGFELEVVDRGDAGERTRDVDTLNDGKAARAASHAPEEPEERPDELTQRGDTLALLAPVVEKMVASGHTAEAEHLLMSHFDRVLEAARESPRSDENGVEQAARLSLRLGRATREARFVEYVFELYSAASRPLPLDVVDELYSLVRQVPRLRLQLLRDYLAKLQAMTQRLGPAERFVLQRLEGLEKVASSR